MDYESFSPIADKIVHSDGSITTFAGDVIAPASADGVALYESMLPTKDGFLQPDGSIKQLKDILGGGAETYSFGTSNTAANVAVKSVEIPAITSLNIGQVIYVLPSITNSLNDYKLKLNDFDAYPVWYRGANQSVVYINTWEAGITVRFIFNGTAWEVDAQIRRAVTTEWLAGTNTRPSSITPNQLYNVITSRLATDQYSNFGVSDTAADQATKIVNIPSITALNPGQEINVSPIVQTTTFAISIKLNDFPEYPVRINGQTPTANAIYIAWRANTVTKFIFDGNYWTTYSPVTGASANEWLNATSNVLRTISPQQLRNWRQNFIPDLPTTGSYSLKCIDGVPQWVAD
jgi:hypothetical protein